MSTAITLPTSTFTTFPTPTSDIRRATEADTDALHAMFCEVYGATSHPELHRDALQQHLEDRKNIWLVFESDSNIVGVMALIHNAWNQSYELGRAITLPEYRRSGIAQLLVDACCRWLRHHSSGELLFGFPRALRIHEICRDNKELPFLAVGHDGGVNIANGKFEYHLIIVSQNQIAPGVHLRPQHFASDWVATQIFDPLGTSPTCGVYPNQYLVGPSGPQSMKGLASTTCYEYSPENRGLSLHHSTIKTTDDLMYTLEQLTLAIPDCNSISLTLMADKQQAIKTLVDHGFCITAYLPAWFAQNGHRYDCIRLVYTKVSTHPATHQMESILEDLNAGLATLTSLENGDMQ